MSDFSRYDSSVVLLQQPLERNYHIFYQMCSNAFPDMQSNVLLQKDNGRKFEFAEECLIVNDPSKYFYVAQGMLTIDGIDDVEEMKLTDEAMDVLGFTKVCLTIDPPTI